VKKLAGRLPNQWGQQLHGAQFVHELSRELDGACMAPGGSACGEVQLGLGLGLRKFKNPATSPRWFCFRVEDFSTYSVFFGGNGEHVFFKWVAG